jgi:serine/threonine protein kinase
MKSDMWSFGVIVYVCLFGGYPFETDDEKLYCDGSEYQNNELLRNLLVADPESRFSSAEALDLMNGFDDVEAARDSQPLQKLIIPANFVTQRTVRRSLRLKLKRTTRVQPIVTRRAAPTTRKRKPQKRNRSAQANKENKKPCTAKKAPKNMKKIM